MDSGKTQVERVHIDLTVQDGRGNGRLGMETQTEGLAPVHIQAVDKKIIVQRPAGTAKG